MANNAELFSRANEEFVEENYEEAVKFYTQAIDVDNTKDEYYVNRSHAFIKLEKFTEALGDAEKATRLNSSSAKAYLRKGVACFHLDKFELAKEAFIQGAKLQDSDNFATWIRKCEAEINLSQAKTPVGDGQMAVGMSGVESPVTSTKDTTPTVSAAAGASSEVSPTQVPMPSGAKTRYDWYQTETQVVITILLKNVSQDDLSVDIQEKTVSVTVKLPTDSDYSLELELLHPINHQQSQVKVMASKIELKLKKQEGIRWTTLESDGTASSAPEPMMSQPAAAVVAPSGDGSHPPKYPSSALHGHDWDKLVAEITEEEKEEKPEGEAALNKLFQQIYSDGSDEVRKAMNKSFVESGGTVLSTNWNEIGTKKVDCKPPEGMEWKKWSGDT
ncbi:Protein SGT1 [Lamellibrachia satsuma]|nr:Protein SGT1 [Lamellibrachia satsuma]